ncbi:hypothetical protein BCR34DRAFT_86204 [Clohesyomyces aquaticus]|uniref:Uncharacterized protein n=1 Tax=Clohesyomyces aquaticus TaxID=1231657 RepID=A0A1Y2A2S5_9PLEO|nr:hypothetical protein BCR34DRAFT_86204 [Clohesyomyces aquaticus]
MQFSRIARRAVSILHRRPASRELVSGSCLMCRSSFPNQAPYIVNSTHPSLPRLRSLPLDGISYKAILSTAKVAGYIHMFKPRYVQPNGHRSFIHIIRPTSSASKSRRNFMVHLHQTLQFTQSIYAVQNFPSRVAITALKVQYMDQLRPH